jgi:hypothetical protein
MDVNFACHFGWGGAEQILTGAQGFTILTPRWTNISPGLTFPTGNEADGTPLYTCHAEWPAGSGAVHPGKYRRGFGSCHIGFGGAEIAVTTPGWELLDIPVYLVK